MRDRFTLCGRQGGCRLSCVNLSFFWHLVNLNDHVTHGDDVVVAIVDSSDFARGCRGDLGDQLVREHLAKILVFFDLVANFDEELFYGGFLGTFSQIRQRHINLCERSEGKHLAVDRAAWGAGDG